MRAVCIAVEGGLAHLAQKRKAPQGTGPRGNACLTGGVTGESHAAG